MAELCRCALRTVKDVVFALVVALALVVPRMAAAQAKPLASASEKDKAPAEEEAADSPRASMRTFLDLCDRGRWDEGTRYLDLPPSSAKKGPELTKKLCVVLAEKLGVKPEELSQIEISRGHVVPIRLVKHEARAPEDEPRWVFSQSTVAAIDALYASLRGRWIREKMPAPLIAQGPLSIYWWQWATLPILAALCVACGRFFAWLSGIVVVRIAKKWRWSERVLPRLKRPVTMGFAIAGFALAMPYLGLTVRADDLIDRLLRALAYLAFFWGLLRTVTVTGEELASAEWARTRPSARSLTGVVVRLGKVVVAALALMVALSELGYPVTSVIAGLGIGGVALALAAQKTVENLFGSVSILADQPFVVGDTIRVDTVEGVVESIGLRSTRMRTADRTLIIIPNGKLADMRIESLGARERIRFATKLLLARDTSIDRIKAITVAVKKRLDDHEKTHKEDVSVRLSAIGEQSYDVEVSATLETLDAAEFAKLREELLCACIEEVEKAGAKLAVPTRRVLERAS